MSSSLLINILEQLESLTLEEKRILSNRLALLNEENQSIVTRSRLTVIRTHQEDILQIADNHGAFNIRYLIEEKEVIFIVDLAKERSLFDLGGLLVSLRELLGFEVVVFTETTIKEKYRANMLNNAIKLLEMMLYV